jgi:ribosomal protein S3AE
MMIDKTRFDVLANSKASHVRLKFLIYHIIMSDCCITEFKDYLV